MVLKILVIRAEKTEIVFVVTSEEEQRILSALKERNEPFENLNLSIIPQGVEQSILEPNVAELKSLISPGRVLVVSNELLSSVQIAEVVCEAQIQGMQILDFQAGLLMLDPSVPANAADLIQMIARSGQHQDSGIQAYVALKRAVEPLLAAVLLLLLMPTFLVLALAIKLTSPGPVFYWQTRMGRRGRHFEIVKFRSMLVDAEKNGPVWASTSRRDARLSPIGGFLRSSHLDEIPQLWNIIRGELSFIGPRPERPVFCRELEEQLPLFKFRTLIKPGVTGWAQVHSGYANSVDDSKRKLEFDLYYVLRHSPFLDVRIIFRTLTLIFKGGTEGRKRERMGTQTPRRRRFLLAEFARRPAVPKLSSASIPERAEVVDVEIG